LLEQCTAQTPSAGRVVKSAGSDSENSCAYRVIIKNDVLILFPFTGHVAHLAQQVIRVQGATNHRQAQAALKISGGLQQIAD
jgi:hypothetical protein